MNKTIQEAVDFANEVKGLVPDRSKVDSIICAPALFLDRLLAAVDGYNVHIGAQTMHYEESGAFTGEISPAALEDLGVSYCIIGHSERRDMFNETDESVNKKTAAAFRHNIKPIICVGETLEQRERNETKGHVANQVSKALQGLTEEQVKELIIAYEPIWAIGTGKSSTAEDANEVCGHIRQVVESSYSGSAAQSVKILYGGSVNPGNIDELMAKPEIDGALVGGASLDPHSFLRLLEAAANG